MDGTDELEALRQMVIELLNMCDDSSVLDMIYKLIPLIT